MASDGREKPKASFKMSVGKKIDAALGDVIRGLLKKPAKETGNLLADGIGILGDKVRRKREINAQLGMEEVRKKLEAHSVDMKDITPPKEEELHLLINGMSLTDDENVRDMWAGLFAMALEPNSDVTAERPVISVLEGLSTVDAKVIDLLAFIQRTDDELKINSKKFRPTDFAKITPEEKEEMNSTQETNSALQRDAVAAIRLKADEYGLSSIPQPSWADNLMRQGVIERTPVRHSGRSSLQLRSMDERDVLQAFGQLNQQLEQMQQVAKRNSLPPERLFSQTRFGPQLQLEVQLTGFGKHIAYTCGLL